MSCVHALTVAIIKPSLAAHGRSAASASTVSAANSYTATKRHRRLSPGPLALLVPALLRLPSLPLLWLPRRPPDKTPRPTRACHRSRALPRQPRVLPTERDRPQLPWTASPLPPLRPLLRQARPRHPWRARLLGRPGSHTLDVESAVRIRRPWSLIRMARRPRSLPPATSKSGPREGRETLPGPSRRRRRH